MTSVLAAQPPLTFRTNLEMDALATANNMQDPILQRRPKAEADAKGGGGSRGRRRSRLASATAKDKEGGDRASPDDDGADDHSSGTEGPSRKRRRSRKGLDKKFECPQEGCGKSYSRAEHL